MVSRVSAELVEQAKHVQDTRDRGGECRLSRRLTGIGVNHVANIVELEERVVLADERSHGDGALDVAGGCEIGRQTSEDDCGHLVDPVREQPLQRVPVASQLSMQRVRTSQQQDPRDRAGDPDPGAVGDRLRPPKVALSCRRIRLRQGHAACVRRERIGPRMANPTGETGRSLAMLAGCFRTYASGSLCERAAGRKLK